MTMPSASPLLRPRLKFKMACEMAGVGVYSSSAAIMASTSLAASTSRALAKAGAESAWVSKPMNSGPPMFCCLRYSHIDWLMART